MLAKALLGPSSLLLFPCEFLIKELGRLLSLVLGRRQRLKLLLPRRMQDILGALLVRGDLVNL